MKLILKRSTLKNKRAETDVRDNTKNETPFQPEYDADNRPTSFSQAQGDQSTIIECGYDYTGRRYMKKVTSNGTVSLHQRYIYRGYLQIACVDLRRSEHPALWYITWDPTEPVATRPLAIQLNATWYTYSHDLTKNVTELYKTDGLIATSYDYSPYGAATAVGIDQPLQWSSEYHDAELALTYYNYRHYNPTDGRWINRDPLDENGGVNLYAFVQNSPIYKMDYLGRDVDEDDLGRTLDLIDQTPTADIKNILMGLGCAMLAALCKKALRRVQNALLKDNVNILLDLERRKGIICNMARKTANFSL